MKLNHVLIPNNEASRDKALELLSKLRVRPYFSVEGELLVTEGIGEQVYEQLVELGFDCDLAILGTE